MTQKIQPWSLEKWRALQAKVGDAWDIELECQRIVRGFGDCGEQDPEDFFLNPPFDEQARKYLFPDRILEVAYTVERSTKDPQTLELLSTLDRLHEELPLYWSTPERDETGPIMPIGIWVGVDWWPYVGKLDYSNPRRAWIDGRNRFYAAAEVARQATLRIHLCRRSIGGKLTVLSNEPMFPYYLEGVKVYEKFIKARLFPNVDPNSKSFRLDEYFGEPPGAEQSGEEIGMAGSFSNFRF